MQHEVAGSRAGSEDTIAFLEKHEYKVVPSVSNKFMVDVKRPSNDVIMALRKEGGRWSRLAHFGPRDRGWYPRKQRSGPRLFSIRRIASRAALPRSLYVSKSPPV